MFTTLALIWSIGGIVTYNRFRKRQRQISKNKAIILSTVWPITLAVKEAKEGLFKK